MGAAHIIMSYLFIYLLTYLSNAPFSFKSPSIECESGIAIILKWKCNSSFLFIFYIYVIVLEYTYIFKYLILE